MEPNLHRDRSGGWRTRDVLRTLAIITGFYIALQLLWVGRTVVLLTFLGVLFGVALTAGVNRLERRRVPRGIGAVLIVLAFLGSLAGLGALTAPSITSQLRDLKTQLPQAIGKIQSWVRDRQDGFTQVLQQVAPQNADTAQQPRPTEGARTEGQATDTAGGDNRRAQQPDDRREPGQAQPGGSLSQGLAEQIGGIGRHLFGIFSSTLAVLGGIVLILFVAVFVAVDAATYHDGLMHLFPHRMRSRAGEVLSATATTLRRWLFTQFIGMVVVGALTTVVLLLLGIPAAVALGIIAGILEFIPIAGPIIAAVPAVAMGFLDGPERAIYVALAYIGIQQTEANLLYPLLMKKGLEIPPVLTIVAQGLLSLVFGFVGLLVAVPMLAATIVPIKMLYVRDVVGDQVKLPGDEQEAGEDGKDRKEKGGNGGEGAEGERMKRKDSKREA
jgi:predicted PurR-regulated permease PerM